MEDMERTMHSRNLHDYLFSIFLKPDELGKLIMEAYGAGITIEKCIEKIRGDYSPEERIKILKKMISEDPLLDE